MTDTLASPASTEAAVVSAVPVTVAPLSQAKTGKAVAAMRADTRAFFGNARTVSELVAVAPTVRGMGAAANRARCALAYAADRELMNTEAIGALLGDGGIARKAQSVRNDILIGKAYVAHGVDGDTFDTLHATVHRNGAKGIRETIAVPTADFSLDALTTAIAERQTARTDKREPQSGNQSDAEALAAATEVKVRDVLEGETAKVAGKMTPAALAPVIVAALAAYRAALASAGEAPDPDVVDALAYTLGSWDADADAAADLDADADAA